MPSEYSHRMHSIAIIAVLLLSLACVPSFAQVAGAAKPKMRAQVTSLPAPLPSGQAALPLSPGDLVEVRVFQEDDMTTDQAAPVTDRQTETVVVKL